MSDSERSGGNNLFKIVQMVSTFWPEVEGSVWLVAAGFFLAFVRNRGANSA